MHPSLSLYYNTGLIKSQYIYTVQYSNQALFWPQHGDGDEEDATITNAITDLKKITKNNFFIL